MTATETAIQATALRGYRPYPAYKASGVEWLGEIPKHWDVKRLKNAVKKLETGGTPESDNSDFWTDGDDLEGTAWVAISDMTRSFHVRETVKRLTADGLLSKRLPVLHSGTLLYSMYASLGKVALLEIDAVVNQAILGIVPDTSTVSRDYLRWWLEFMQGHIQILSSSSTQENLNAGKVRNIPVFLPDEATQQAIANFLDRESARIDALVAKKQRLIELLQEQRIAFITRAVTKGLDPSVPMKDSGVEWLGEIPEHWEAKRIKWVAKMESGHTPDKKIDAYWRNGIIPWVSLSDTGQLREVDYIGSTAVFTTPEGIANSSAHLLPSGTVVFSRDATIGLCAITQGEMAVSQHFIGWVCGERIYPEYLLLALRSMSEELERLTMGATVRTIGMPNVKSLVIPLPPLQEQQKIVHDAICSRVKIDELLFKVREAIARLQEFRVALISSAVTGKIDVREEVR